MPDVSIYGHICESLIYPYIVYYIVIHNIGTYYFSSNVKPFQSDVKNFDQTPATYTIYGAGLSRSFTFEVIGTRTGRDLSCAIYQIPYCLLYRVRHFIGVLPK